ncbi:TolC family protein [Rubrolithibacter danxiaensis]|uniref:TolC family protein n=1 Tax=Rubrolithibacter danxiaensis TaxID=3390805 RepID=UPI003BF82E06
MPIKYTSISFLLLLSSLFCYGQTTMMDDISYPFLQKLITIAKENYPKTRYYSERAKAAKAAVTTRKLSWLNFISASYIYQPNSTIDIVNPSLFNGLQAGVFINFGLLLQTPSEIKKAKAEYRSLVGEEQEYYILLETEVKKRYFDYIRLKKTLELYSNIVDDVESIEKHQRTQYEKSEITFKEFNEAVVVVATHSEEKIETEASMLTAKAALEELLGRKLESIQ